MAEQITTAPRPPISDLHQDLSSLADQTRFNRPEKRPNLLRRKKGHSLGDEFPIEPNKNTHFSFSDKTLGSDVPAMREAGAELVVANIFADPKRRFEDQYPWHREFQDRMFAVRSDIIVPILTGADLDATVQSGTRTGGLQSVEGIYGWEGNLGLVDRLWSDGIRSIIPVHNADSEIGTGHPTTERDGLTKLGKAFVTKAAEQGMTMDLSHASDATARDILDITEKVPDSPAPMISHTGSRSIVPHLTRATDDGIAVEVARRGGVVGVMPASWLVETDKEKASVASVGATIDHYLSTFSDARIEDPTRHVAIGSDFDGMGTESVITGMNTLVNLGPTIQQELMGNRGYSQEVVNAILSKNAITLFSRSLPRG